MRATKGLVQVAIGRAVWAVLTILVTSVGAFLLPQAMGLDPARTVLAARIPEREPDPIVVSRVRSELGLDEGAVTRYRRWLGNVAQGDLGFSFVSRTPVGPQLARAGRISGLVVATSMVLALLLAVPAGAAAAARPGGLADRALLRGAALGAAVPEYVLGPILVLVFAVRLGVLPSSGWRGPAHLVLPAVTLGMSAAGYFAVLVRAELADALAQGYVVTAQAKGRSWPAAVFRHALPNALTAVTSMTGVWFVGLLGGSVVVEVIFAIPGLGQLMYDAVLAGDVPVIQAALVAMVGAAVVTSSAVDLAHRLLDPRRAATA